MKRTILSILLLSFAALPCAAQWEAVSPYAWQVYAFGVHDTTIFMSGPGSIYRHGETPPFDAGWGGPGRGGNFSQQNVTSFASLGNYFFANEASSDNIYQYTYRTSNNGDNWQEIRPTQVGTNGSYLFGNGFNISGTIGYYYAIRSRDSGVTWDSIANFDAKNFVAIGSYIFANTGSVLLRSTDTGNTWSPLSPQFTGTMTVMDSLLFITGSNGSVIESTDSGSQWNALTVDTAGEKEYVLVLATDGTHLFAGTTAGGVLLSSDTGKTWRTVNTGFSISFSPFRVSAMGVFDTLLFADLLDLNSGTYNFYVRSIPEMTKDTASSVVQTIQPGDTIAIYPNPAMGTVTVLSGGTSIFGISVLNVLGESVMDMQNLRESDITLDVSKLVSGTYFVRIATESGSVLRKVVIQH